QLGGSPIGLCYTGLTCRVIASSCFKNLLLQSFPGKRTRMNQRFTLFLMLTFVPPLLAQNVPVEEFQLENGLKLLMVPRKGDPNVAAGWIAKVGSVNERPGITGISHLFEHMMFKGTHTIGTNNIQEDLKLISEMDALKAEIRKEELVLIEKQRLGEIEDI